MERRTVGKDLKKVFGCFILGFAFLLIGILELNSAMGRATDTEPFVLSQSWIVICVAVLGGLLIALSVYFLVKMFMWIADGLPPY